MGCFLHVVLASVILIADVRDLLVDCLSVVFSSLVVIIDIMVFFVSVLVVLEFLGNLEQDILLVFVMLIVWVDKHVLIIVGDVVILVDGLLISSTFSNRNFFFLN